MIDPAKTLFITGTIPFIVLGLVHWLYTFMDMTKPHKLAPRDDAVRLAMEATPPKLTTRTTMWKAWMGFNLSLLFTSSGLKRLWNEGKPERDERIFPNSALYFGFGFQVAASACG